MLEELKTKRSWHGRQGDFFGEAAVRWGSWAKAFFKRQATDFSSQAKGNLRGSENFSGTGSPDSGEAGHQIATVAQLNLTGMGGGGLLMSVGNAPVVSEEDRRLGDRRQETKRAPRGSLASTLIERYFGSLGMIAWPELRVSAA